MHSLLKNLRIVEGASFIAAPSCGLHLLQMGAEVIRFDDMRRSPDRGRWPVAANGHSLYWEGLNKGKKSIALDLSRPEGREIAVNLITAPGEGAGLFLTNYPTDGFLSHDRLVKLRPDLITLRVMGWSDGRTAVDYTVNPALGVPAMTGPASLGETPVNHVLPAWDLLAGAYAAAALLAAERYRRDTGAGQEVRVPLADVATTALGNLGQVAEVLVTGRDRPRMGNDLFGALGRDFLTQDQRRIMIVAITSRQWSSLISALNIQPDVSRIETELSVSFADEGVRFTHREPLFNVIATAVAARTFADLATSFDSAGVCWGPYRTLSQAVAEGALNETPGLFNNVSHPSGYNYPTPGSAASFSAINRESATRAPRLGEHTEEILSNILGLNTPQIGRLLSEKVVQAAVPVV